MSVSIPNFKSLMKKRNPFARTPLLIFTEYKPFQFLFDFLLCPFECSYPSKSDSKMIPSGESGMFSIADRILIPLSRRVLRCIAISYLLREKRSSL